MKQVDNKHSFGYKLGYFFGVIVLTCLMAVMVALTIKFLYWLF